MGVVWVLPCVPWTEWLSCAQAILVTVAFITGRGPIILDPPTVTRTVTISLFSLDSTSLLLTTTFVPPPILVPNGLDPSVLPSPSSPAPPRLHHSTSPTIVTAWRTRLVLLISSFIFRSSHKAIHSLNSVTFSRRFYPWAAGHFRNWIILAIDFLI